MPAEKTARHAARASASIEVLDQLKALLADGRNWIQGDYWNDVGGFQPAELDSGHAGRSYRHVSGVVAQAEFRRSGCLVQPVAAAPGN
jgi:hypothetical protein